MFVVGVPYATLDTFVSSIVSGSASVLPILVGGDTISMEIGYCTSNSAETIESENGLPSIEHCEVTVILVCR
jgi:hypothetical protein